MVPWVMIVSVVLPVVLLVLLVVLLIRYCQKKSLGGIFCISTQQTWCPVAPGAQEGYRESTPTRCPDQPSGPAAQTPRNIDCAYKSVGNTVYAQVTTCRKQEMEVTPAKGSESVTIYSTVQPCRGVGPVPAPSGSHPYFLAL